MDKHGESVLLSCHRYGRTGTAASSPILEGKTSSSSSRPWIHVIRASTYSGAESAVGFLNLEPSSKRNSNLTWNRAASASPERTVDRGGLLWAG